MAIGVLQRATAGRLSVIKHVDRTNYGPAMPKRISSAHDWKQSLPLIEMKSFANSFISPLLPAPTAQSLISLIDYFILN